VKSLKDYLSAKASRGLVESQGQFTLEAARAAEILGLHALPTPLHYLLKAIQAAHRLGAEAVKLTVAGDQTRVDFHIEVDRIAQLSEALSEPMLEAAGGQTLAADLALALLGGLSQSESTSASWGVHNGTSQTVFEVDSGFTATKAAVKVPGTAGACRFAVQRPGTWKFWETVKRRTEIFQFLRALCAFSPVRITVNGKEIPRPDCSFFNEHLREFHGSEFSAVLAVRHMTKSRVAASNLLFELAPPGQPALSVKPPPAFHYTVVGDNLNLWKQALVPENLLRPDGEEVCAWMLQVQEQGRRVPASDDNCRFSCVIALNLHGPGVGEAPRVKVVRHGVLVLDGRIALEDERLEPFRGCSLLYVDSVTPTDAGGFHLVQDDLFLEQLFSLTSLIEKGQQAFDEAAESLHLA
jgi:hypothetical protein